MRLIIAGGGTGGHIFPAIAIANALKKKCPDISILFIGAKGKMEMEKVPQAGYAIKGLTIAGFNRNSWLKNIGLPLKLLKSFWQVKQIVKQFKPDVAIGVGGYASFPVLRYLQMRRVTTFLHESNSFAGKSNILLGRRATKIFVADHNMSAFFPEEKIIYTGNPVRKTISESTLTQEDGMHFFRLDTNKKTVLVVGGSLGAQHINETIATHLNDFEQNNWQLIWQTGKHNATQYQQMGMGKKHIRVCQFITQMEYAYVAADVVISRAGAMAKAELCLAQKPVIFIPLPSAAENHQTKNALSLVTNNAALLVADNCAAKDLMPTLLNLMNDQMLQNNLKKNIAALSVKNADESIAEQIIKAMKRG